MNLLRAHAYSVLWSVRGQGTPCFVFQGTKKCISSKAILTNGKKAGSSMTTKKETAKGTQKQQKPGEYKVAMVGVLVKLKVWRRRKKAVT